MDFERVGIYIVRCKSCGKILYSKVNECRFDFGERLKKEGLFYNNNKCSDCYVKRSEDRVKMP